MGSETALEHDDRLLAHLRAHPTCEYSGRQLVVALGMGQDTVRASLHRLLAAKQVEKRLGSGAEQNAQLWRLAGTVVQPPASLRLRRRKAR